MSILADGNSFSTYSPNYPNLIQKLSEVEVLAFQPLLLEDKMPSLFGVLLSWFPMLLLIAVWIFFHETNARRKRWGNGLW